MNALNDNVIRVYATGTYSDEELKQVNVHDNATMVMTFSRGTYALYIHIYNCELMVNCLPHTNPIFNVGAIAFAFFFVEIRRYGCDTIHEPFSNIWLRSTM